MPAVKRLAALRAHADFGIAAAVHQHNRLLARGDARHQGFAQFRRHQNALLLPHRPHVHNLHVRERGRGGAMFEPQVLQVPAHRIVERLKTGGRTPQNHERPVFVRQMEGEFPRVVTRRRILLFKGTVVFLVQYHNVKPKRRQNRTARAEHHLRLALEHGNVSGPLFWSRERRMQHMHRHLQKILEPLGGLRRKPNLGDQNQNAKPAPKRLVSKFLVHARFAGTRDAM